jgi:uracil-DNA glycosylase
MKGMLPQMEPSWARILSDELSSDYFEELMGFVAGERRTKEIYPPDELTFAAFNTTPVERVKAVIIGQDPYHGPGQANGLCFSVNDGVRLPPSLRNIFKELATDMGFPTPRSGNLGKWAKEGVLLLNTVLTVEQGKANSHQGEGWEQFTDAAISRLSKEREGLVFLLWGKHAQAKESLIPADRGHLILKAAHPSPFSAHRGFLGCKHFSKANAFLMEKGDTPIDWSLE